MVPSDRILAKLAVRVIGVIGGYAFPNEPKVLEEIVDILTSDVEVKTAFYYLMQEGVEEWRAEVNGVASSLLAPQASQGPAAEDVG